MDAAQIAQAIPISQANLYRALKELEIKGFLTKWRIIKATHYTAETLSRALDNYALYQRELAQPLIQSQNERRQ